MKVLFHHRTRGRGAEGVHIRGVVKGLRQLGHQVSILSLPGADPEHESDKSDNKQPVVKKKGLFGLLSELTRNVPEFVFELFELAFNVIAWWRLRKTVKEQQVEFVYERYSLFLFSSVWWAKRKGLPIVLEVNDSALVHRVRPLFFESLAKKVESWIFRNATGLVFISGHFKQLAQSAYGELPNSVVSPNAADLDDFKIDENARKQIREQLNIEDKVVLGYVGAFVHWHGIDWFVEEIVGQLKDWPQLVLLLVGDGKSFDSIEQSVKNAGVEAQVILPGRVAHEKVADYINAMDYGILPDSNDYGSPMKLFEFMAMGKAMVVPDFSPITEVVVDNQTSWLFKAGDKKGCIDKVFGLVTDSEQQQRVGKFARSYIEEQRQWRHNAEDIMSLLGR